MDCFLYKLNPPFIPKKVQVGLAEILDFLTESPEQHYRGREFEDPLIEEELMRDNKEDIIAKLSTREKNIFCIFAKSLLTATKLRK